MHLFKQEDVSEIKINLSEKENEKYSQQLNTAVANLDQIKSLLSAASVFNVNGQLSTGDIKYAAFRVETLSLIFDLAKGAMVSLSGGRVEGYEKFLQSLGAEVGFTFGRDLIRRLKEHRHMPSDMATLIELWALFENDTGAGTTTIECITENEIHIKLENNPLSFAHEDYNHDHCGFYRSYLSSLINELSTSFSRWFRSEIKQAKITAIKVGDVNEIQSRDRNCNFVLEIHPENISKAFDLLDRAIESYEGGNHLDALAKVRSAWESAMEEKIEPLLSVDSGNRNKLRGQLYKIFKGNPFSNKEFDEIKGAYELASNEIHHKNSKKNSVVEKPSDIETFRVLKTLRNAIYNVERQDLDKNVIDLSSLMNN